MRYNFYWFLSVSSLICKYRYHLKNGPSYLCTFLYFICFHRKKKSYIIEKLIVTWREITHLHRQSCQEKILNFILREFKPKFSHSNLIKSLWQIHSKNGGSVNQSANPTLYHSSKVIGARYIFLFIHKILHLFDSSRIRSTEAEVRLLSVHNSTSKPLRLDPSLFVKIFFILYGTPKQYRSNFKNQIIIVSLKMLI